MWRDVRVGVRSGRRCVRRGGVGRRGGKEWRRVWEEVIDRLSREVRWERGRVRWGGILVVVLVLVLVLLLLLLLLFCVVIGGRVKIVPRG